MIPCEYYWQFRLKEPGFLLRIRFSCGFDFYVAHGKCFKVLLMGNERISHKLFPIH